MVKLRTSEALIVEHTEKDTCRGDGVEGSGKNWLVQILMQVRDEIGQFEPA